VPKSGFSGVQIADRVRQAVPGGWTGNGKSTAAKYDESVTWHVQQISLRRSANGATWTKSLLFLLLSLFFKRPQSKDPEG